MKITINIVGLYRTRHSNATFFQDYRTFTKINRILGYKANPNKFQKTDVPEYTFPNQSRIKLKS